MKTELLGLTEAEIAELIEPQGFQTFRAKQIARWIYEKGVCQFSQMTNLGKSQRALLEENFVITAPQIICEWHSQNEETTKWVLGLADGLSIETVLMRHNYGNSVCVSTQVGCAMGCLFCASTLGGRQRDLTSGEIYAQVRHIQNYLEQKQQKVDTLVIMGSGEPLMNYDAVLKFIRLCHAEYALNMGYRHITLSTSGIVPEIIRLADENIPLNLSISLHAPNNELRSKLMPINRRYPLEELLLAADYYVKRTNRRITYEYILIAGLNDSDTELAQLARLMKGKLASVNLIPINSVVERGLIRPSTEKVQHFAEGLRSKKVAVTLRREMGSDIQAACGQLRFQILQEQQKR